MNNENNNVQYSGGLAHVLESVRSPADIHGLDTLMIVKTFEAFGYSCKPAAQMRGISGVLHDFDFVCTKLDTGEKIIVQSILHLNRDPEKIEIEMVKLRLSTYDCSPEVCLVITDLFTPDLRQMASVYHLVAIDASSGQNVYEQIESLLRLKA